MGPVCQIKCDYCFYLEKRALFGTGEDYRMPDECWPPTRRSTSSRSPRRWWSSCGTAASPRCAGSTSSARPSSSRRPSAARSRSATCCRPTACCLTDEWCAFFKEHGFFIGISLDGPREIHDRYRKGRQGEPTFDEVMRGHPAAPEARRRVQRARLRRPRDGLPAARGVPLLQGRRHHLHPVHAHHRAQARCRRGGAGPVAVHAGGARSRGTQRRGHAVDRGARALRRLPDRHLRGVGAQGRGHRRSS